MAKAMRSLAPAAKAADHAIKSTSQAMTGVKAVMQKTFREINHILAQKTLSKMPGTWDFGFKTAATPAQAAQLAREMPSSGRRAV